MSVLLEARGVSKTFSGIAALQAVDLVVNARPAAGKASNADMTASVMALWNRIRP